MITSGQGFKCLLYAEDSNKTSLAFVPIFMFSYPGTPGRHLKWNKDLYGATNLLFPLGKQSKTNKHIYLFPFYNSSLMTECSQVPSDKRSPLDPWPSNLSHTALKPLCLLMGWIERKNAVVHYCAMLNFILIQDFNNSLVWPPATIYCHAELISLPVLQPSTLLCSSNPISPWGAHSLPNSVCVSQLRVTLLPSSLTMGR